MLLQKNVKKDKARPEELPEPINVDMVRDLKNAGMVKEARKLIELQQKSVLKAKKEALTEIIRKDAKIRRAKWRKQGLCTLCGGLKPIRKNKTKCTNCAERDKAYKRCKLKTNVTETEKEDWKLMTIIHRGEVVMQKRLHKLTIPLIREVIKELGEQLGHKKLLK